MEMGTNRINGLKGEKIPMTHKPMTLDELIEQMEKNSERYDFSDEYLMEKGYQMPVIGEFTYGTSYTPTAWALPYLIELKKIREQKK
jgi:hypothetical protein